MNDSLLFYLNAVGYADTSMVKQDTIVCDSLIAPKVVEFLQTESIGIVPVAQPMNLSTDIITYVLFFLLGIIAMIWHFMPDRFSMIFSLKLDNQFSRAIDTSIKVPGALITGFFWLNFVLSLGVLLMLIVTGNNMVVVESVPVLELLGYLYVIIGGLLLYRVIIIYGTAIIFQTKKMMKQQIVTGRNIQFISGVFLVPVILLLLYASNSFLIYITIVVIVVLQVIRITKIMIIGKSSTMFTALHIILYLCALEIVPILVLIGLIDNNSGI